MKNINKSFMVIVALVALFLGTFSLNKAQATTEVCFCHNVQNNPHTICTDNQGQINGHLDHVGEGNDTAGACEVEVDENCQETESCQNFPTVPPFPTVPTFPTVPVFPTTPPFPTFGDQCDPCRVSPTPTVTNTPTPTTSPTNKPTDVPVGGGSSQGSSSGSTSSSSSSPSTGGGEVLGATTLARTGVFQDVLANSSILIGSLLMGVGSVLYGKKNS